MEGNQTEKWVAPKTFLLGLVSSNHKPAPQQYQKWKAEALVNAPTSKTER